MKAFFKLLGISVIGLLVVFSTMAFCQQYDVVIVESPDPKNYPDIAIRGVAADGSFSATIAYQPPGAELYDIPQFDMKGLFGKLRMGTTIGKGQFEYMQAYDPPQVGWAMGFVGMSENKSVTSFAYEKYGHIEDVPPNSSVLKWTHAFNSIGWSQYDDVHINYQIKTSTKGEPTWIGGLVTDINDNGITVGIIYNGDSFSFSTGKKEFEKKYLSGTGEFQASVKLWGLNNANMAVGTGNRAYGSGEHNFIINLMTDEIIWTELEDPDIKWDADVFTGQCAINNNGWIAFVGNLGPTHGIVMWNYTTGAKKVYPIFDEPEFADSQFNFFCDMTSEDNPIFVGYFLTANGRLKGWIAYPE